ncbi:hypothetical protein DPM16_01340 [Polynucleobacter paneuropaeus]|nr:hypothetical protein DPM16_01340 [Polynucleobacter paneuropaeus]
MTMDSNTNSTVPLLLDVFLFYNELDLLKARLEYLGPTVDYFVISEANIDFAGREKKLLLNSSVLAKLPFSEKIIYHQEMINLGSLPWLIKRMRYRKRKNRLLWKIQDAQRNSTLKPLTQFKPSDIVIFSDLDEFPSPAALLEGPDLLADPKAIQNLIAYSCDQTFFYYNLQNAAPEDQFYGSIFCNLATFRKLLPHKLRSIKDSLLHIANGGWHFSYFMDEEKILNKIKAVSDVENLSAYKNLSTAEIRNKIASKQDLYDRERILSDQEQYQIPQEVLSAIKKYLPYCS